MMCMYVITKSHQTALHIAVSHNQLQTVEFLIIKGAKLDIKDGVSASVLLAM